MKEKGIILGMQIFYLDYIYVMVKKICHKNQDLLLKI